MKKFTHTVLESMDLQLLGRISMCYSSSIRPDYSHFLGKFYIRLGSLVLSISQASNPQEKPLDMLRNTLIALLISHDYLRSKRLSLFRCTPNSLLRRIIRRKVKAYTKWTIARLFNRYLLLVINSNQYPVGGILRVSYSPKCDALVADLIVNYLSYIQSIKRVFPSLELEKL